MALPNLEIPPMECPATLLPTPANLSNMFGGLATFPAKLKVLAVTTAKDEADEYIEMAESLQDTVDTVRKFFGPYDPKWEKLSIPEKEWEIMIQRLIEEYPMYIQSQIMSLLSSFVSFTVPILGISIDVLKICTDREYLNELGKEISGYGADMETKIAALREGEWGGLSEEEIQEKVEALRSGEIDRLYELLPDEYKLFSGEYGLENSELKAKQLMDFIKNECTKFMNGQLFTGFGGAIEAFSTIWDALGLPALPVPLEGPDVGAMIKGIVDAKKAEFATSLESLGDNPLQADKDELLKTMNDGIVSELNDISLFGFKVSDLLGGEFTDTTESLEFKVARITAKLKEFKENWQLFLIKTWMGKVTSFFDAIGLSALTQYVTLDFCTFMGLIGIPTSIDLSSFSNITQIANEVESLDTKATETAAE